MTRQAEISAESRARLLQAARQLFAEDGFRKTTVQAIAERAGISRGSIAWHFGSKQGLVVAVVEEAFDWLIDQVTAALAEPGPAGWERLFSAQLAITADDRSRILATVGIEAAFEKEADVLKAFADRQQKVRVLYADYLQRNGLVSPDADPLAVASALRALTLGLNIQRRFDDSVISVGEAFSALRGVLMDTPPKFVS